MKGNVFKNLTVREVEILKILATGLSNKQIAKELSISTHTVKTHLESIFCKLDVHNRLQASVVAIENNII